MQADQKPDSQVAARKICKPGVYTCSFPRNIGDVLLSLWQIREKRWWNYPPPDTPDFMEDHTLPLDACKLAAGPHAVGCKIHSQSLSKKRLENGHFCCFLLAESWVWGWGPFKNCFFVFLSSCGSYGCKPHWFSKWDSLVACPLGGSFKTWSARGVVQTLLSSGESWELATPDYVVLYWR